jgi:hypothetical protein
VRARVAASRLHMCLSARRFLPWAANDDPRFTIVPERLQAVPRHQQLRDSDLSLPLPLFRGIFSQGLQMSTCWSSAMQRTANHMGQRVSANGQEEWRSETHCAEDPALYDGFEENNWPTLELRFHISPHVRLQRRSDA